MSTTEQTPSLEDKRELFDNYLYNKLTPEEIKTTVWEAWLMEFEHNDGTFDLMWNDYKKNGPIDPAIYPYGYPSGMTYVWEDPWLT